MNIRVILLWGIVAILMLQPGCQNVTEPVGSQGGVTVTTVNGTVLRNDNLSAVPYAIVYDLGGLARDTSKNDGSFALHFQLTARLAGRVVASRVGFGNDTVAFAINPGVDTSIVLRLKADTTSPITSTISGKAASIFLVGAVSNNIGIRGTGSNETSQLTFEVRDSIGVPVSGNNKVNVNFSILGGPGGGEFVFPVSQVSDALTGRVSTRVTSGTKAGVIQVFASTIVDGRVIKSSPVRITISGGLPIQERFSISRTKANIAGLLYDNLRDKIQVIVGDKDGNPVQPGTAVYFTTTGGVIQASSPTDNDGIAAVDLISANPRPTGGIAIVTAKTIGDSGTVVSRTIPVVFSGAPQIVAPSVPFVIPDSGTYSFNFEVQDLNGNPLTEGTAIAVSVDGAGAGEITVEGDNSVILPDTDDPWYTQFSIRLRDNRTGGPGGLVNITIKVTSGQNGSATYKFSGIQQTSAAVIDVPPSAHKPSKVAIVGNPTATNLFVAGVGNIENSVILYEVRDSLGIPIDTSNRVSATFAIDFYPNSSVGGGTPPKVIPASAVTNDRGQFTASVVSGTQAGVLKLVARVPLPDGGVILSEPVKITVHAGFPDQDHFTLLPDPKGWQYDPGLLIWKLRFTVAVGDTFSNPVQAGTAIYLHSQAGVVQTGQTGFASYTTADGTAFTYLYGVNPLPLTAPYYYNPSAGMPYYNEIAGRSGYAWVTAQTQGRGSDRWVQDSVLVNWVGVGGGGVGGGGVAGGGVFFTGIPTTPVPVPTAGGSSAPISITIKDNNGNPLAFGATINAVVLNPNPLLGWNITTSLSAGIPSAPYARFPGPNITDFTFNVTNASLPGAVSTGQTYQVRITVEDPVMGTFIRYFNIVMQ
jgi:hypothetical protein